MSDTDTSEAPSPARIAAWIQGVGGPQKASGRVGASIATLGRWASGETAPRGGDLIMVQRAVTAWERAQARKGDA